LTAPSNFDRVFTLASGPPAATNFFGLNAAPNRGGAPNSSLPAEFFFFDQDLNRGPADWDRTHSSF
jgi:hypothetical protein